MVVRVDKNVVLTASVMLIFLASVALAAKPDFAGVQRGRATVTIPAHAAEVAPGIFSLGSAIHDGRVVQGYAFVKYREGFGKPTGCNYNGKCQGWEDPSCADCQGGGGEEPDTSSCYGYLARGAKWKTIEPYIVNPSNTRGLSPGFVSNNIAFDITKWESAAGTDILGDGVSGTVDGADTVRPDDKNEVYFADIKSPGAIGVTIVWGVFSAPPPFRELVEWDQVYDDKDFDWSEDCESENCTLKMDFENIATHELGHSAGMDDLYDSKCSEVTMYGYASNGETEKRTLEDGDIAGIKGLY